MNKTEARKYALELRKKENKIKASNDVVEALIKSNILNAFNKVVGKEIPFKFAPRREGDIASCYASPLKAYEELGFKAKYGIDDMARDAWRWRKNNPNGYEE